VQNKNNTNILGNFFLATKFAIQTVFILQIIVYYYVIILININIIGQIYN